MSNSLHILLLGATGPCGLIFCDKALKAGHKLTIYARNLGKLPQAVREHGQVTGIQGEYGDANLLARAAQSGATVLVSFAGPGPQSKGTPITDCYKILFPLLVSNNFNRALILCTPSWTAPEDGFSFLWSPGMRIFKLTNPNLFNESHAIGTFWSSQSTDQIKWTLFRVPGLTNGELHPVNEAFKGDGKDGVKLSRKSMIDWVMKEMTNNKWIGKAPMLSGSG